ncbi:MAG: hypothetical protein ABI134_06085 [Byssovorax sp.]
MMSAQRSRLLRFALVSTLTLGTASAYAAGDEKAVAESLYQAGLKLMAEGKNEEACPKLVESQRIDPASGTQLALAKCYDQAGKTASAWALYKDITFAFKKAGNAAGEKAASDKVDQLEKKLSRLQINAAGDAPGLVIRRDAEEVGKAVLGTPIAVDPGPHVIEATAPGYQVWQTTVTIGKESDTQSVNIPALTMAAKKANTLRTVSYVVGGVGLAGVVVGGIFGGLAASAKGSLKDECPSDVCPAGQPAEDLAGARSKATISTIGVAVGGAALATGIVLFIVSGKGEPRDEARPAPAAAFVPVFGPQGGGFSFNASF